MLCRWITGVASKEHERNEAVSNGDGDASSVLEEAEDDLSFS